MEPGDLNDWVEPVLVLAPTGGDAALAAGLMAEVGVHASVCDSMADVVDGVERGAAALVLASEALDEGGAEMLSQTLGEQPAWSDIPVILLTLAEHAEPTPAIEQLMDQVGNISLLERPFRSASFISVLKVALRARRRQFEVHRLLESERRARTRAVAEGRRADSRERELRASEERFRLIANSIPQLAWMAGPDGRLFWFNERWYTFCGAPAGDPRAGWRAWLAAQDSRHFAAAEQRWRRSLETGVEFDMELPMRRHDGAVRWFLMRAVPAQGVDGRPTLWFGTGTDITEHRETAQALRQSEERLLLAVEIAQLGLWTLDTANQQVVCSAAFRAQLGRDAAGLTYEDFWRAVHPEDRAELEERMHDALRESRALAAEYRIVRWTGEVRWILAHARPVLGRNGSFVQLVGVSLDVTERKQAERRREAALSAERAARSEAERVARMKDEFLATLSHELRTPLNAVLGWSEVLQRAGPRSADFERGLSAITRNARLQAQLIEDLLDTSRIVSGSLALDLADVALQDVVDGAIESVQPSATARNVQIERDFDDPVQVRGDRRRLQQVVWNLLTNAVKFSPAGGTVVVRVRSGAGNCVLEVQDQGQGIEPAFLPHVFERFRQEDSSRKRRSGGLGLGLSIVRHLVQLHGGTVSGQSAGPGTGALFRVELPRIVEVEAVRPAGEPLPADAQRRSLGHARILVVDDEADARELLVRVLGECHASVMTAASADEALALVREQRPDLILSDIGMPGKDGLEFIQEVRALAGAAGRTPAIAVTAFARSEDRDMALRSGFQRHLGKPIDALAVAAACAALLANRDLPHQAGAAA